jgi:hypothetical protein
MDAVVVIKKAQHQQTNAFALLQNININPRENVNVPAKSTS